MYLFQDLIINSICKVTDAVPKFHELLNVPSYVQFQSNASLLETSEEKSQFICGKYNQNV